MCSQKMPISPCSRNLVAPARVYVGLTILRRFCCHTPILVVFTNPSMLPRTTQVEHTANINAFQKYPHRQRSSTKNTEKSTNHFNLQDKIHNFSQALRSPCTFTAGTLVTRDVPTQKDRLLDFAQRAKRAVVCAYYYQGEQARRHHIRAPETLLAILWPSRYSDTRHAPMSKEGSKTKEQTEGPTASMKMSHSLGKERYICPY